MDKELIILAIYINVNGCSMSQVQRQMNDIIQTYSNMYNDTNKNVKVYWIPVRDQETKIECIYPFQHINDGNVENELLKIYKLIVNSKNEEVKEIVKDIERKLKFKKIKDRLNET